MPKDKIDGIIKKASNPNDAENYEQVRYEGYAPGGVAVIVEALTENRNRTAADVRAAFTKYDGNLGESGSVSFMFDHIGIIIYPISKVSEGEIFEAAVEAGADDCVAGKDSYEIYCDMNSLNQVRDFMVKKFGDPEIAKLTWKPKNTIEVDEEKAKKIMDLIGAFEDLDDVQEVYANFEIPEDVIRRLAS